jgi:hypothetical protein
VQLMFQLDRVRSVLAQPLHRPTQRAHPSGCYRLRSVGLNLGAALVGAVMGAVKSLAMSGKIVARCLSKRDQVLVGRGRRYPG